MGEGTRTRQAAIHPLITESMTTACRVRLVLKPTDAGGRDRRTVEGMVLDLVEGRDGRLRLRVGIPTGSGDPVEVRVLLESVEKVEKVESDHDAKPSGPPRKATLAFGSTDSLRATVPPAPVTASPTPVKPGTDVWASDVTPSAGNKLPDKPGPK